MIFVSGIHEEAQEDQIFDLFADYGTIKNLHANLDRKTGYLKGYALLEFEHLSEAKEVVKNLNGYSFLGKEISVDFAFQKAPKSNRTKNKTI